MKKRNACIIIILVVNIILMFTIATKYPETALLFITIMFLTSFAIEDEKPIWLENEIMFIVNGHKYIAKTKSKLKEIRREIRKKEKVNIDDLYMLNIQIGTGGKVYFGPKLETETLKFSTYYKCQISHL